MKPQFKILLFIVCVNLAIGLCFSLNLAGTEYVTGGLSPTDSAEYEGYFNSTKVAEDWSAEPMSGVPILGDIYSGFQFLFHHIQYLIDGFPTLLQYISDTYVVDLSAKTALTIVLNAVRAIYAVMMVVFFVEFITGRNMTD